MSDLYSMEQHRWLEGNRRSKASIKLVKHWAESLLKPAEEESISVMEQACSDPDCPDIQTLVVLWKPQGDKDQWVFEKGCDDLTQEEVSEVLLGPPYKPPTFEDIQKLLQEAMQRAGINPDEMYPEKNQPE
jgi:hypothetical protein